MVARNRSESQILNNRDVASPACRTHSKTFGVLTALSVRQTTFALVLEFALKIDIKSAFPHVDILSIMFCAEASIE